jgi:serine protease Do
VPVDDTFKRVIDRLKNGEEPEYGFLGVQPGNLLPEMREGNEHGVLVQDVVNGTPADRYGIQRGDIITHVDGNPIYDFDALVLHVGSQAAGEQVELAIDRSGRKVPLKLVLAKYRVHGQSVATSRPPAWRGARVDFWTAVVDFRLDREQLVEVDHDGCVVVTEVEPESLAARAGLKPGLSITHVADARVTTPQEFRAAVESLAGAVKLRIVGATIEDRTELTIDAE